MEQFYGVLHRRVPSRIGRKYPFDMRTTTLFTEHICTEGNLPNSHHRPDCARQVQNRAGIDLIVRGIRGTYTSLHRARYHPSGRRHSHSYDSRYRKCQDRWQRVARHYRVDEITLSGGFRQFFDALE